MVWSFSQPARELSYRRKKRRYRSQEEKQRKRAKSVSDHSVIRSFRSFSTCNGIFLGYFRTLMSSYVCKSGYESFVESREKISLGNKCRSATTFLCRYGRTRLRPWKTRNGHRYEYLDISLE